MALRLCITIRMVTCTSQWYSTLASCFISQSYLNFDCCWHTRSNLCCPKPGSLEVKSNLVLEADTISGYEGGRERGGKPGLRPRPVTTQRQMGQSIKPQVHDLLVDIIVFGSVFSYILPQKLDITIGTLRAVESDPCL